MFNEYISLVITYWRHCLGTCEHDTYKEGLHTACLSDMVGIYRALWTCTPDLTEPNYGTTDPDAILVASIIHRRNFENQTEPCRTLQALQRSVALCMIYPHFADEGRGWGVDRAGEGKGRLESGAQTQCGIVAHRYKSSDVSVKQHAH